MQLTLNTTYKGLPNGKLYLELLQGLGALAAQLLAQVLLPAFCPDLHHHGYPV